MAAPPRKPDDHEAPELGADELVVTSDAPSRDRDPELDLDKVTAQLAALVVGMVVLAALAIGLMSTAH